MQSSWNPTPGPRFNKFVSEQPEEARASISLSSTKILSRCRDPKFPSVQRSQLVVGEVQSGKTMSFTGVAALARDNGFPIVIVICGTKDNLREQTEDRIKQDLRIGGDGGANPWLMVSASDLQRDLNEIAQALGRWNDPVLPEAFKQTIIITTLKTVGSLKKVTTAFNNLKYDGLEELPVLIVDDEADQAGLNVAEAPDEESSVYASIGKLRSTIPNNDYLMYTATPQANLLLRIEDHLSPDSVTVLTSGADYMGGRVLFGEGNTFVNTISPQDVSQAVKPDLHLGPPPSLKLALSYFLVGMAHAQQRGNPKPCSMLIHPGTTKKLHKVHQRWIKAILESWKPMLSDPSDEAFKQCKKHDFEQALNWIQTFPEFEDVWREVSDDAPVNNILHYISFWIPKIELRVINSDRDAQDISVEDWKQSPGWILVGGEKLARGFTIENLTTTYMPRSAGIGNADSIQQRGRFFGYKKRYADLLKGWFSSDVRDAFASYVEHEESIRKELIELDNSNEPVRNWRRKFLLDPTLHATRKQVIKLLISHHKLLKGFIFRQDRLYSAALVSGQIAVRDRLKPHIQRATKHPKDTRTAANHAHLTTNMSLEEVVALLVDIPAAPTDKELLDARLFAIRSLLDDSPNLTCEVTFMDSLTARDREISQSAEGDNPENWTINNLMAGRSARYEGDAKLVSDDLITVQFHSIMPLRNGIQFPEILAVAIHWPAGMREGVIWEVPDQR